MASAPGEAGPSEPAPPSWLRAIDNVYALFEEEDQRGKYPKLAKQVEDAVRLCEEIIEEYGVRHIALSFNGGKDCTVLVHLLSAALRRLWYRRGIRKEELPCIPALYITCSSPFDEVEEFVNDSIRRYNLRLVRQSGDMKEGLEQYLNGLGHEEDFVAVTSSASKGNRVNGIEEKQQRREIKAIFVGTRRSDPHGADLTPRKKTDPGWPEVERIQPILDWSYQDVWHFLRCPLFAVRPDQVRDEHERIWGETYGAPYCLLYDEGYTSLGSTHNTHPNPVLDTRKGEPVREDDRLNGRWLPAYRLTDESLERAGRSKSSS